MFFLQLAFAHDRALAVALFPSGAASAPLEERSYLGYGKSVMNPEKLPFMQLPGVREVQRSFYAKDPMDREAQPCALTEKSDMSENSKSVSVSPEAVLVTALVNGERYRVAHAADDSYIAIVPDGSPVSAAELEIEAPEGFLISRGRVLSSVSSRSIRAFDVVAADGRVVKRYTAEVRTENTYVVDRAILAEEAADCRLLLTLHPDYTVGIEILIPLSGAVKPHLIDDIDAILQIGNACIYNLTFSCVDESGNVFELPCEKEIAGRGQKHLRIRGVVANMKEIENETIRSIRYTLRGDCVEYRQTFPGDGLRVVGMQHARQPVARRRGCDTGAPGLGASLMLLIAMSKIKNA